MRRLEISLKIETLVKECIGSVEKKWLRPEGDHNKLGDSNATHLGGIIEVEGIMNNCGLAAFSSALSPYYINCNDVVKRECINSFLNKYYFLTSLEDDHYWIVIEDAASDFEELLYKLDVRK
ncbi:hypothetical protein ACFFIX_20280 [Metabacillus herbersteinensis]|uniref:Uncharacterized protein n=1 Tax=Metabacillus herbersteinensis TaxID=283816 RepID=A0ABV6GJ47_9BACI